MSMLGELWAFMRARKKYWLWPIVLTMVLLGAFSGCLRHPYVCTPEDAFRCIMGTGLDVLAVGNCYLRKEDQDLAPGQNYETAFELD